MAMRISISTTSLASPATPSASVPLSPSSNAGGATLSRPTTPSHLRRPGLRPCLRVVTSAVSLGSTTAAQQAPAHADQSKQRANTPGFGSPKSPSSPSSPKTPKSPNSGSNWKTTGAYNGPEFLPSPQPASVERELSRRPSTACHSLGSPWAHESSAAFRCAYSLSSSSSLSASLSALN